MADAPRTSTTIPKIACRYCEPLFADQKGVKKQKNECKKNADRLMTVCEDLRCNNQAKLIERRQKKSCAINKSVIKIEFSSLSSSMSSFYFFIQHENIMGGEFPLRAFEIKKILCRTSVALALSVLGDIMAKKTLKTLF